MWSKNFLSRSVLIFLVSTTQISKPEASLDELPQIKMIVGSIEYSESEPEFKNQFPKDLQTRFGGMSCRTDQNGLFFYPCDKSPKESMYIVLTNGNYWDEQEVVLHDRLPAKEPIAKIDPTKNSKVLIISEKQGKITLEEDRELLEKQNFTIPYDQCIVLNSNPEFFEKLAKNEAVLTSQGTLVLPGLKIRSYTSKKNPAKKKLPNLTNKTVLRKCKHIPFHKEVVIHQKIMNRPNPRRNKSSKILLSVTSH